MELSEIILTPLTKELLRANGQSDRSRGISKEAGWEEIRHQLGFDKGRSPAREVYEDGWYGDHSA